MVQGMRPSLRRDDGFSLAESVVALAVVAILATAFAGFMVSTNRISAGTAVTDAAAQVALSGMERAQVSRGAALLTGRAACDAGHPCAAVIDSRVTTYLGSGAQRWDAAGAGTSAVPLPSAPETVTLGGIPYQRYYYVAACWQVAGSGGACTEAAASTSHPAAYVRLVVAVTAPGMVTYVTAALLSASAADPYLES
jgi:prepilin-type N-terminal cleavage/methylation domain-containing protein